MTRERLPECHPERKHKALGMCDNCYARHRYQQNPEPAQARARRRYHEAGQHLTPEQKARKRQRQRERYASNPDRRLVAQEGVMRGKYGMTIEDYDLMLANQGGRCAICESGDSGRKGARFAIDHNHETGVIRGLLCRACNTGLGLLNDDPERIRNAAKYLEVHGDQ